MNRTLQGGSVAGLVLVVLATSSFVLSSSSASEEYNVNLMIIYVDGPEGLDMMGGYLGIGYSSVVFEIIEDIDLSDLIEANGWSPIGNDSNPDQRFYGTVRGNGHTVSGLWTEGQEWAGLFGSLGHTGKITDLNVEIDSEKGGIAGMNIAGAIVGSNYGTVQGCTVTSSGEKGVSGTVNIGGMIGYQNGGAVIDCHSYINVNSFRGTSCVGGLVGLQENNSRIEDCSSHGRVFADEDIVIESYPLRTFVDAPSPLYDGDKMGGLLGMQDSGSKVIGSFATGDVYSIGTDDDVGGLVGRIYYGSLVSECYSTGDVMVEGFNPFTGGLVGNEYACLITNCYSTGDVEVTGKYLHVGSLLGFLNRGEVENSFATGEVITNSDGYVGGLIGYSFEGTVRSSFFNADTTHQTYGIGNEPNNIEHARRTQDLIRMSTFDHAGWSIGSSSSPWGMYLSDNGQTGYGYPFLTGIGNHVLISPSSTVVSYNNTPFTDVPTWATDGPDVELEGSLVYLDHLMRETIPKDAGSYLIAQGTLGLDAKEYQIFFADDVFLVIEPAKNTVIIEEEAKQYGDWSQPEHISVRIADPGSFFEGDLDRLIADGSLTYQYYNRSGNPFWFGSNTPVGEYRVALVGNILKNYDITFIGSFTVMPKEMESSMVAGIKPLYYTGNELIQTISVEYHLDILQEGVDFTAEYSNNINIGTGHLTLSGQGNFTGNITIDFNILPPLAINEVIGAVSNLPETITGDAVKDVAYAYDLYQKLDAVDRTIVPAHITNTLMDAVNEIETNRLNTRGDNISVSGNIPWHIVAESRSLDDTWEHWDRLLTRVERYMGDTPYTIVSMHLISFTDLIEENLWHPEGNIRITMDAPDRPLIGVAHITGDNIMMRDAVIQSGLVFRANDSGIFVILGEEEESATELLAILFVGAIVISGAAIVLIKAFNGKRKAQKVPAQGWEMKRPYIDSKIRVTDAKEFGTFVL